MSNETPDIDDNARIRASMTTPGIYSLTGYSETPSRNGVAWNGTIRQNGVEVGRVHEAGVGGMLDFEWTGSQHMYAFTAEAKARYGDDYAQVEEAFVNDLATAAQNNRKRSVIFITDDSDLSFGECFALKASVTLAQAKAALTDPRHPLAGKNPMIWDKSQSIFVPAADIEA